MKYPAQNRTPTGSPCDQSSTWKRLCSRYFSTAYKVEPNKIKMNEFNTVSPLITQHKYRLLVAEGDLDIASKDVDLTG